MESVPLMISLFGMTAAVGSSIAAIINANTAKNNLNELLENNKRAQKPFLIIKSKEIDLSFNLNMPRHLLNWDTATYDLKNRSLRTASYIEMTNIGNGIAKNVSVKLAIKNEEAFLKSIAELNNPSPYLTINIYKDINKFYPEKLSIYVDYRTEGNKAYGNDMYDFEPLLEKEFIAVEKGGVYKIAIPTAFMILYNAYFQFSSNITLADRPYLEIVIEHEDIIGIEYKHDYSLIVQSANITSTEDKQSKAVDVKAIFDIKENKKPAYYI